MASSPQTRQRFTFRPTVPQFGCSIAHLHLLLINKKASFTMITVITLNLNHYHPSTSAFTSCSPSLAFVTANKNLFTYHKHKRTFTKVHHNLQKRPKRSRLVSKCDKTSSERLWRECRWTQCSNVLVCVCVCGKHRGKISDKQECLCMRLWATSCVDERQWERALETADELKCD